MANIYDDVELLQEQVAALQTSIEVMEIQTLAENADLHTLAVGTYLIPNTAVCATILHKPTTSNATSIVKVVPGGAMNGVMEKRVNSILHTISY